MSKKKAASNKKATSKKSQIKSNTIPTKHELCLYELLKAGPSGIYKLGQCQQSYGETCLPTTISELGIKRRLLIDRVKKPHTNGAGGQTHFTWYWLANHEEAKKAVDLINILRKKRGSLLLDPIYRELLIAQFPEATLNSAT